MSKNRILLFWEDDQDIIAMFSLYFQEHGYPVEDVKSFDECVEKCKSKTPILLIIQRFMEGYSISIGLEYVRKIRENTKINYFPIIVGWADFSHTDKKLGYHEAFEAGANACFGRVFDITEILEQVKLLHANPSLTGLVDRP